ncbi:YmfL family putative regulatory protein [Candidatus Williamhamiltonella defendens]|uniref:Uncharacterized protein n=2 Tax=Candidatus Williamhamiltonella defendens TaxID=138072 RepID=A0A249E082_9ENTR|nr:YmfL family putative regulatory protein [Candidatus Hamiltonella defensa]ASX26999.1 hypothetical protein BA171_02250 [Candidatus Hamiltonella defensa (Bemisia tabaci)]ASX27002.1 hypothetical protein BA171_02395 [Candidatus Hamiltonella defensa (Bemisia tabaci)]
MMEKRELINEMLKQIQGGKSVAAAYLGMNETKFNNRLYEHKGSRFFNIDELSALQTLSQSSLVAEYFAQRSDTLVVPMPEPDTLDNVELYHMGLLSNVKGSAVDELILGSIQDDGGIDRKEEEKIMAAHRQHMASRDSQVKATLRVYGRKKSDSNKTQHSG